MRNQEDFLDLAKEGGAHLDEIADYRLVVEEVGESFLREGFEVIGRRLYRNGVAELVNGRNVIIETLADLGF